MKPQPFEAQLRSQEGIVIIDLTGELNAFAESALNQVFSRALDRMPEGILLNFSRVSYINSTGIALIVSILAEARRKHCRLDVFGLSDHYKRIFQITRLTDFISIYVDEASALASFSSNGGVQGKSY